MKEAFNLSSKESRKFSRTLKKSNFSDFPSTSEIENEQKCK